jgi:hypothetical protein
MRRTGFYVSVLLLLLALSGCSYYRMSLIKDKSGEKVMALQEENHYLILHSGDQSWHLENISLLDSTLSGELETISRDHNIYRPETSRPPYRCNPTDMKYLLKEIHIYVDKVEVNDKSCSLKTSSISRIEYFQRDTEGSIAACCIGGLFGTTLITLLASL